MEKEIEKLKKQVGELQAKAEEYLAGWKRERADFLNYKKDEAERMENMKIFVQGIWLTGMLKVFDSFERALKDIPPGLEKNTWVDGIIKIRDQFWSALKTDGFEEIKVSVGDKFDPKFHEAIECIEKQGIESGTIIEILEKGYSFHGTALRPVKVNVAK